MELSHIASDGGGGRSGPPSKWAVLAICGLGVFMCTLDTSIVNVSLPAIAAYFHQPVGAGVEWVIIAYLVIIAALLLTIGRLSDRIGRKPLWIAGLAIFTAGSALCGAAPSLPMLIGSRVLQGVGAAQLMAVSPAMLTGAFPPEERGRALGYNATIVALGISAGPALGGVITQAASWRWVFYLNVPIGVIAVVASALVLRHEPARERMRFDVPGAIALGVALAALTAALSVGNDLGWSEAIVLALFAITIVAIVLFVLQERRHPAPLIDARLFDNRLFTWATISLVISFLAAFAVAFLLPFYFEQLRGFGPAKTGMLLTPFPLVVGVVAPFSGAAADRFGTRWLAAGGMAVMCIGLVLLAGLGRESSTWGVIWPQLVMAVGQGAFQSPNNSAIMGAAPRDRQGVAAGMLATGRTMGQAISVAIAGAVFTTQGAAAAARARIAHPHALALEATFLHGFRWALYVCAAIAAAGVVTSLLRGRER